MWNISLPSNHLGKPHSFYCLISISCWHLSRTPLEKSLLISGRPCSVAQAAHCTTPAGAIPIAVHIGVDPNHAPWGCAGYNQYDLILFGTKEYQKRVTNIFFGSFTEARSSFCVISSFLLLVLPLLNSVPLISRVGWHHRLKGHEFG